MQTVMINDDGNDDHGFRISVAAAITIGLLASFIQSLGLTMQRKSHVQNEQVHVSLRQSDWQRPLWVTGFVTYFTSNIFGSIFQIGALPLVILGPLGAVSLLWNAILARLLLGDVFSVYLVIGSVLIATGAVLIGCFGVVHESTHPLEDLVQLYFRPAFVIVFIMLCVSIGVVCVVAHLTEWEMERMIKLELQGMEVDGEVEDVDENEQQQYQQPQIEDNVAHQRHLDGGGKAKTGGGNFSFALQRRSLGTRVRASSVGSPGKATLSASGRSLTLPPILTFGHQHDESTNKSVGVPSKGAAAASVEKARSHMPSQRTIARTRLFLGVAYGSASGTLSGICLLFAKTGVELLILTIVGVENEFLQWQTWVIVSALISAAILQLWYLNKALRLVGPTLICPLAFCFYNLSGMINGLVYYDQVKLLSPMQIGLVTLGTSILLAGVWLVSIKSGQTLDDLDGEPELEASPLSESTAPISCMPATERTALLENERRVSHRVHFSNGGTEAEAQLEWHGDSDERRKQAYRRAIRNVYHMLVTEPLRGFSVGLGAASPGFAIRPARRRTALATRMVALGMGDDGEDGLDSPQSLIDLTSHVRANGRPPRLFLHGRGMSETGTASQPRVVSPRTEGPRSPPTRRTAQVASLTGDPYVGIGKEGKREDLLEESLAPLTDDGAGCESLLVHAEEVLQDEGDAQDRDDDAHTSRIEPVEGGRARRGRRWPRALLFGGLAKGKARDGDQSGA